MCTYLHICVVYEVIMKYFNHIEATLSLALMSALRSGGAEACLQMRLDESSEDDSAAGGNSSYQELGA